ncbi:MAG: hypothetical protein IPI73_03365 [Betaproteobacteria bacterium]|nr:hypothetical protein [Betaproteobacteria bacterium]
MLVHTGGAVTVMPVPNSGESVNSYVAAVPPVLVTVIVYVAVVPTTLGSLFTTTSAGGVGVHTLLVVVVPVTVKLAVLFSPVLVVGGGGVALQVAPLVATVTLAGTTVNVTTIAYRCVVATSIAVPAVAMLNGVPFTSTIGAGAAVHGVRSGVPVPAARLLAQVAPLMTTPAPKCGVSSS